MLWLRIAAVGLALAAPPSAAPVLREQAWTLPGPGLAHALTHAQPECLKSAGADGDAVELGRALFRSPILLGGPAARIGLSCASCHVNGRANARFFLDELTDRAGAADVTSEWSSAARGDGVLNPRPIPDLHDVARRTRLGSQGETSLERFVRSVIVEEFQGAPPPDAAFAGVIAYLRALDSEACPSAGEGAVTLEAAAQDVRRALRAARALRGDLETQSLALGATQAAIGRIVERLPPGVFDAERRALQSLAGDLAAARNAGAAQARTIEAIAPGWLARFDAAVARAARRARETYFDARTLSAALASAADISPDRQKK